jgi:hypothetical protein
VLQIGTAEAAMSESGRRAGSRSACEGGMAQETRAFWQ